ncbi:protein NETWORKED 2A-like [Rhododendron vialii]|uniref:protein NETWORKED 2A-like n=1 Tax=Rhododendron vialii TaxID=182163 RepID=UPI00265F0E98|nr:protein NETWORKED 2A-like [Rhododendron vialii]
MLHRAARNAYSWWWASHIRTKQSKWLDQNLQDMEEKVEYIIKIIEEDGDSFAKRAEMYYKKRPELLNFVEDSFRGYRALAERYDHLSKELQSANRTIASVYPEKLQLAMDEEDEEISPTTTTTSSPFSDSEQPSKNFPAVPKLNIPKITKIPQKRSKAPTRLMSKKGLLKMSCPTTTDAKTTSGMSKVEALEEIDKLQKNILGLQTEKEFIKSSYESGVAKYWEIEEQVTEMQAKVNLLQDEFGIGTFIDDDEARTLMAATALKSCQEALIRLEEKHKVSDEEARIEYRRIQESRKKLKIFKENFGNQTLQFVSEMELKDLDQQVESIEEKERNGLELLRENIKEHLEVDSSGESLTMSELAEKIDELVEKVITLETSVSSQNALIKRLRSETDELQGYLRSLEKDKEALISGSDSKSNKIRELEKELLRIQKLNQKIETQNKNLQIRFTQASLSVDHLSEKLLSVKQEEEEVEQFIALKKKDLQVEEELAFPNDKSKISKVKVGVLEPVEVRNDQNVNPERRFKESEDVMAFGYLSDISKNERDDVSTKAEDSFVQPKLSCCLDNHLAVPVEMRDVPNDNAETKVKENQDAEKFRMKGEAKKYDNVSIKAEEKFMHRELSFRLDDCFVKGQVDEGSKEHNETMAPGRNEVIKEYVKIEAKEKKNDSPHQNTVVIAEEGNWFQFYPCNQHEDLSVNGQVKAVLRMDSKGFSNTEIVQTDKGEKKLDCQDLRASVRPEEGNIGPSSSTNPFNESPERVFEEHEGVVGSGNHLIISEDTEIKCKKNAEEGNIVHSILSNPFDDPPKRVFNVHEGGVRPSNEEIISEHTKMDEKRTEESLDYNHVRVKQNFAQSTPSNQHDNVLGEFQMQGVPRANPEKGFKEHEDMMGPVDDSLILENASTKKEEKKDDVPYCSTSGKANAEENCIHLKSQENHIVGAQELEIIEDENQPNWRELFPNGLDDRETILLQRYTLVLRNYKEAKKKLGDIEKEKHESLFKSAVQINELKNANDLKDAEIQCLHKKLNLCLNETPDASLIMEGEEGEKRVISDQNQVSDLPDEQKVESHDRKGEEGEKRVMSVDELHSVSTVEEKFRSDIDGLLEENIEYWLRFSSSFHQIQKFQTSVEDLQEELTKLRESKKQEGSSSKSRSAMNSSDVGPIYTHLREIETELALWLEHNSLLEDDLHNRLSSLSTIHEQILRVSSAGSKEEEETLLSSYQAAKFQGEVLNMKQENNKVGYKLQEGLDRVKELQSEIAKTLEDLEEEFGLKTKERKSSSSRSRIPLRSFLFGVRLRKQKPSSLFQCMSPALQKQYSDLGSLPT